MGLPVRWGDENGTYASFEGGGHLLALFDRALMAEAIGAPSPIPKSEQQDDVCLNFAVEDVDAVYEALKQKGVVPINQPHDRKDWGIRCFHLRDPAGILLEVNTEIGMSD